MVVMDPYEILCPQLMRWAELGRGVWQAFGRIVRAQVFPIGIDVWRSPRKRPARMAPDTWAACAKVSETGP